MKYYLVNTVLDTKSLSVKEMQDLLQYRLDVWLGKDKTQIKVEEQNDHTLKFTLFRTYGSWFEDPQRFQPQTSVFSWDQQILLGENYEEGTTADLETHIGRYIITYDEESFFYDYKKKARENHCTRIRHLEQQSYLDRIELTVELLQSKKKRQP